MKNCKTRRTMLHFCQKCRYQVHVPSSFFTHESNCLWLVLWSSSSQISSLAKAYSEHSEIPKMKLFCDNSYRLEAVICFCRKFHFRFLTRLWIRLWLVSEENFRDREDIPAFTINHSYNKQFNNFNCFHYSQHFQLMDYDVSNVW